jgi:hypothetical protein
VAGLALALGVSSWTGSALASPRTEVTDSWLDALDQFGELELEEALTTVDGAIARAEGAGYGDDPVLAAVYALRGGIEHSLSGDEAKVMVSFTRAVQLDWNVQLPIELQSDAVVQLLERARGSVQKPGDAIVHTPPQIAPKSDVTIGALANMVMPEGGSIVIYYRKLGSDAEFVPAELKLLNDGSMGEVTIPAAAHGDVGLEYFFYVFTADQQPLANRGNLEDPIKVEVSADAAVVATGGDGEDGGGGEDGGKGPKKPRGKSDLPRAFINLGVGTGFGIARGAAELTYLQYRPGTVGGSYTTAEQACALARWKEAGAPLPKSPTEFALALNEIQGVDPNILPDTAENLTNAYDASFCSRRHPVSTGVAPAPFHISPEVGVRVSNRIVLSLFGRLQVVTGSKVFEPDPKKGLAQSYTEDVLSPNPEGVQIKHKFTWAIGAKFKYFIGKQDRKLKLFTGFFAGFGASRLRVNMNFSNDRNGNSVADEDESAVHGLLDLNGDIQPESCKPVWPYNRGCLDGNEGADIQLAAAVRQGASQDDLRIDTVRIGPGFVGGLFGVHYQIVKYFGIYAEADLGGWFPSTSSLLLDINAGPVITF